MRPLPEHAWRGRKALEQPQAKRGVNAEDAGGDELGGKLVKFEDLLASLGATKSSAASPSFEKNILVDGEVDLLKSMDTDPHLTPDTSEADTIAHNTAAASEITQHTYIRSKGDVQYVTVPLGHVWLAGDNMGNSTDSRHYGPVPLGMVRGKVLARVWPSPRWLTNKLTFVD
nr:related to IMP1-protease, mitochondrial [Melanopsichium pennsylvanicum 4]